MVDLSNLENVVKRLLIEEFETTPVDVRITTDFGSDDEPILRVVIILDAPIDEKFVSFLRHLRTRFHEEESEEFPVVSFISRPQTDDSRLEAV